MHQSMAASIQTLVSPQGQQKQRGVYSEIVNPENSIAINEISMLGPSNSLVLTHKQKQGVPKAFTLSASRDNLSTQNNPQNQFAIRRQRMRGKQTSSLASLASLGSPRLFVSNSKPIPEEEGPTVDPKVLQPYDPIPGQVPRRVAIDRRKKEYAQQNLEELLKERDIDLNRREPDVDWLPLELFDDTQFDDYSNEDWISKTVDEEGVKRKLFGKGIRKLEEGKYTINPVQVEAYENGYFLCTWKGSKDKVKLPRIYICFDAENPQNYVMRVFHSLEQRKYANSIIRYNHYIDNMPFQDLSDLDQEQKKRLENLAKTKRLEGMDTNNLITEVNHDYQRTMNKIIFDKYLEDHKEANDDMYPTHLVLPPKPEVGEAPNFGMKELERHKGKKLVWMYRYDEINQEEPKDFTETFKDFCFSSLFIKEEVITALQEIKVECNNVLEMDVFNRDLHPGMVLEEFKHIQESATSQLLYHLKGAWINNLIKIIKTNFAQVGKGWFNMKETSKITYDFGKLKRFLTVVRLMMQDTVLTLSKQRYIQFQDYIMSFVPDQVVIKETSKVQNIFESDKIPIYDRFGDLIAQRSHNPLFAIQLQKTNNDDQFIYSVEPEKFINVVIAAIEKGLEEMSKIPDLEPKILSDLYKSTKNEAFIKTPMKPRERPSTPDPKERPQKVADENKWIWEMLVLVKQRLEQGVQPVKNFLKTFDKYSDILLLNPDKYVEELESADTPIEVEQIQAEIDRTKLKSIQILDELPNATVVSYFEINIKDIRTYLYEKYQKLQKNLVDMISRKARFQTQQIYNQFQLIQLKIKEDPENIEKLTEIKEYMSSVPNELAKLKIEMAKCFDVYDILDGFSHKTGKEDLDKKWIIYGASKDTMELIEKREKELEKDKVKFLEQMKQNQEDFKETIENLERTIINFHQNTDIKNHEDIAKTCVDVNACLQQFFEESKKFNSREALFDMESTNYDKLNQMIKDFAPYSNLWITTDNWYKNIDNWKNNAFDSVDAPFAERFVDDGLRTLQGSLRYFKDKDISLIAKIAQTVKAEFDQFKPKVPLLVALRKPGMKERHWKQVSDKVGFAVDPNIEGFCFQKILDMGLMKNVDECVDIGERAYKEFNIESMLNEMQTAWQTIVFEVAAYKTSYIIRGYDEIQMVLDEHIVNTQAMQFSPFKKPFEDRIISWNNSLKIMSDVLEEWAKCQSQWMYLQPIFDSADIAKQLPNETKKFKAVDSTWKHTMSTAYSVQNVLAVCSQEGLLERLQESNKNLEAIQKELNNYLEKKREKFARFYFLSNDDLLEILSQTKEPTAVQPHLKKVFENINEIEFDSDKKIHAMFSAEKEKVDFVELVDPNKKNVEDWMGEVEEMMCKSVRAALFNSVQDYVKRHRSEWVLSHPGQCVLNGSQAVWTTEVEQYIKQKNITEYWKISENQLKDLVELVRKKMTKQQKVTLNALIVLDVHAKDVVETLHLNSITDIGAFEWIAQLRYYYVEPDFYVRCVQTDFPYGYEYLGNTLRLVITPLTDKCYMTLMGALKLNLGGAPAGPAGTGKTESTKDLAKALAKQCVVFNCSDQMDYIMVGKFFKGLASAGAWCCFDEFNRINIEVLSVIAQQLLILFGEKAKGTPQVEFEGSTIKLLPTFCVFITMNPGYAGRTELPDNLKALFRAVAMMVPDYAMIGEIMLYSFGFTKGRDLARKMVATFKLSSEQLSSQDHYDYGMRAVRSVINAAGLLKAADPDMDEEQQLLRALRDVNVPKFLKDDLPLFENIMSDLFPGLEKPNVDYGELINSLKTSCKELNLQPIEPFLDKVIQLYDTTQVRHGLMIVGPTGGGKTKNYKVLQKAMTALEHQGYAKVNTHILNPKSITMGQLYGQFNEQTHEWADGILAYRVRECCRDQSIEKHWVMFDGPVDAIWIESMNTVLDDNKKLCLNSGQILTLTPHMTMMFEVEDLTVASPATVSRCGMIYMEPGSIGLQPLIDSWTHTIPSNIIAYKKIHQKIHSLLQLYLDDALEFLRRYLKETVTSMDNNLVQSLMRVLDCYLRNYIETEVKKVPMEDLDQLFSVIEPIFYFALTWSVGATTDEAGREKFDKYLKKRLKENKCQYPLPEEGQLYDFEFDQETKQYISWSQRNKEFQVDSKLSYHEIMIPTTDSTRNIVITKLLLINSFHVMCPGPTGTGKTQNLSQLLQKEMGDNFQYIQLTFSAQTSANQTQDTIDGKLDKRRKGVFGPPIGKKFIIYVDDFNMPKKETYGAQPPIELIRQYLDHQGWYNRRELSFMRMEDIIILSSMGPPGGGRTFITNRIVRHFNILGYTELNQATINQIFQIMVAHFLKRFTDQVKQMTNNLVIQLLVVYNTIKTDLLPTPSKSHYTFNLRDIWKVCQGLCSGHPKNFPDSNSMMKLWYHEIMRVFHDRLINSQDREYLKNLLVEQFSVFELEKENVLDAERIIFGDFMQGRDADPRFYCQISDVTVLVNKMDAFQEDYTADMSFIIGGAKKPMKLVMFSDACEHISRIARIIRQPQGNALLLGIGGSGRQSLARMATFLTNYKLFQIEVVKNYTMRSWREDIKKVLMLAGVDNKAVSFLFCDTQIIKEQMLEDINNILNSGDVTGIYQEKDFEDISAACKGECVKRNIPPTKMNVFTQYLIRVKKNIHMIIAMSPLGEAFVNRLRMFPSLINGCTIDWFTEWPEEALIGVGRGQLMDYEEELQIEAKTATIVEMCKNIHKSVEKISEGFLTELRRHNYVTPTSYLELLTMFRQIMQLKKKEVENSIKRLQSGLNKLIEANTQVEEMRIVLKDMQPELEKASQETEVMMISLSKDKAEADEYQKIVSTEEEIATKQAQEAAKLAAEAEAAVAEANESLETTLLEVQKLKKEHLIELKSMTTPPVAVRVTMGGVVILLSDSIKKKGGQIIMSQGTEIGAKKEENYFETAKKYLLNDTKELLTALKEYDRDSISAATIKKLDEKIICMPEFNFQAIEKSSFAGKFLFMWVKAMVDYYKVFTQTQPLRDKLSEMKKIVDEKTEQLRIKKEELAKVNKKIRQLQAAFDEKIKLKEELTAKINECEIKLDRASKLTEGLSEEKTRWASDIKRLEGRSQLVPAHSITAAGMVAYSGPFTSHFRRNLETEWVHKLQELGLENDPKNRMISFLGEPIKIQSWNIAGLPKDDTSTENGIIIDKGRRWPLMIDPQTQANKFIKNIGKENAEGIETKKANDSTLMKAMELAVQFGRWMLIENVGTDLDPSWEPIVQQQYTKQGSSMSITIGDKTLSYSEKFKLFLTTTIPNPHYPPETFVKVTIINFAITPSGLEEQMLAQIVALENPTLEQKKTEIVRKNAADQKELLKIEDSILHSLSSTSDIQSILMDETLINQLSNSKKFAAEINQRVKDSKITEAQIDEARESYRPVAFRASLLFFCIVDLAVIDPMYQYSLMWFTNLFIMGVENSVPSNKLEERLENLNSYFTYSLYENICRSLFERHKLLFSFLLAVKILFGKGDMDENEWRYFLTGPSGDIHIPENPTNWISETAWPDVYRQFYGMESLPCLEGIEIHFLQNSDEYKGIFDSPNAHEEPLPNFWNDKLNNFQKLIILKAIRPDKLIPGVQNWISEKLSKEFIIVPTFDLGKCYKDSSIITPLIFVLSAGSDPVADFLKFAEEMSMSKRIDSISLGQGQGPKAEKIIRDGSSKGTWVLLQNCHLAQSWMPELERICEELDENLHKDFRLWLTSMPSQYFPISVLQSSIKMTMEPPTGLRANLLRTYKNLSEQELNDCSKAEYFKKLLFGFCLFHAIIQDRRKFGPIGWNIAYEFTNEDLMVCRRQLKMLLDEYNEVPYKVINFLGAEINYGGRVTDDKDVLLIKTILINYICPDALKDGYKFSDSGLYYQPQTGGLDTYMQYIESLPLNPAPEAFGLHDNAEITNAQNETRNMLETITSIQPRSSGSSGKSREEQIEEIANSVQARTPEAFDILTISRKYPTSYEESMNTVLVQELFRYNKLLDEMKDTLINLKKGLKGLVVLSEDLEKLANSLYDNQVPNQWADKGFLSLKPLSSWVQDLNDRTIFLNEWITCGTPKVFWISGFFFPQAFVTGTVQNYARKHTIAIDKLNFNFYIRDDITYKDIHEKPEDGCLIYGIFLEGARWNSKTHMLTWPKPKELYSDLPLMHLVPVENRQVPTTGIYNCPLYKVVSRRGTLSTTGHSTNFVMYIELCSKERKEIWIRAGVATFLSLRY